MTRNFKIHRRFDIKRGVGASEHSRHIPWGGVTNYDSPRSPLTPMSSSLTENEVLGRLPGEAQLFIKALQRQFEALPCDAATGAVLTTMSAAVGPLPILTSLGEPVAATFQAFVTVEDPLVAQVINAVAAPFRSFQRASFAESRLLDVSEVDARIGQAQREFTQWQVSERIPDPEHDRAFRRRIAEQRSKLPKVIMEESPVPGCLGTLLRRSPDESIFLLSTDPARTERLISYWLSRSGAEELRLLHAGRRGASLRTTTTVFANPHVDTLLLGNRATVETIRGAGGTLPPFWLFDASSSQARVKQPQDENVAAEWERFIHGLLQARFAFDRSPLQLSPAAWQWFAGAVNEAASRPAQSSSSWIIERETPEMVASLAALLHAANRKGMAMVSLETMQDGARISSWLRRQSYMTLDRRYDSPLQAFIRANVVRSPGATLMMREIRRAFAACYNQHGSTPDAEPTREEVADAMKRIFDAKMRKDFKPPLPDTRGWKGFALRNDSVLDEEPKVTLRIS